MADKLTQHKIGFTVITLALLLLGIFDVRNPWKEYMNMGARGERNGLKVGISTLVYTLAILGIILVWTV